MTRRPYQTGGNKKQLASRPTGKAAKIQSNARAPVAYAFLVVFARDDTICADGLAVLEKLVPEDGGIDDEREKVIGNIFLRVDKKHLIETVWQEIQNFRQQNHILCQ